METETPALKTLAATGHRPIHNIYPYDVSHPKRIAVRERIIKELVQCVTNGYNTFISGMALGFDIDFAISVLELRDDMQIPGIYLRCAIPFKNWDVQWKPWDIEIYNKVLAAANNVVTVCEPGFAKWKYMARNKWMVDESDHVLALWNGQMGGGTYNTIRYALDQGKPVRNLLTADINKIRNIVQSA